jgi:hypothetical protein
MALDIFYLYGIIYILCQLYNTFLKDSFGYEKELEEVAYIPDITDSNSALDQYKKIREIENNDEKKNPIFSILYYVNMAWVTIGFFTSDWRLFVGLAICAAVPPIVIGILMMKKIKNEIVTALAKYVGMAARVFVASFILYHHFYLPYHI